MTSLRIASYEDYLNALPESWEKTRLLKELDAHNVSTEPDDDYESYLEACNHWK